MESDSIIWLAGQPAMSEIASDISRSVHRPDDQPSPIASRRQTLAEPAAKRLLREAGIAVPRGVVLRDAAEAKSKMKDLKFPVVAKIVSSEVLHKSDIGGVRLNLGTAGAVEEAIGKLQKAAANASAKLEGYLVEEMATPGTEMVIGGVNDPRFGPMVMVGMGGIYIEVFKDVCYRLCPITREEAGRMLDELRCAPLLDGARGRAPVSREALIDMLLKVGGEHGFMMRNPSIAELDLNPVIVDSKCAVAVDAAIVIAADEVDARPQPKKTIPAAGDVLKEFQPLFQPSTIAVVGASAEGGKRANIVIRRLKSFGFSGAIYPIHPTAPEIEGLRAYRSMSETPQPIDYAYVSIAGERVAGLLRSAHGRVRF